MKDEVGDNVLGDVIVGWDAAALDVDSPARPTAADVVSGRMVSVVLRRGGGEDEQQVRLSWLYLPRRLGTPARPHQLFLALGGEMTLDQVINPGRAAGDPVWHFRVDVRSDAGAAWLISGEDSQASRHRGHVPGLRRLGGRPGRDRRVLRRAGSDRDAASSSGRWPRCSPCPARAHGSCSGSTRPRS